MGIVSTVTGMLNAVWAFVLERLVLPIAMPIIERNLVPDFLVRFGIRTMLSGMLVSQQRGSFAKHVAAKMEYVKDLKTRSLAENTADANKQHYEVPSSLYDTCLGEWKKYSSGYWPSADTTLRESEEIALQMVCDRAQLKNNGMTVLDMGCGWGSASLYIATHFPSIQVTGVSNSASQREYIMEQARRRGLTNVNIITADINVFKPESRFDRVVSIEMMEHVKNYERLLGNVASWLKPGGKMFVHIFTHKTTPFHYTDGWMAENFFTGGQMPSDDLLLYFQRDLSILDHWIVNGKHYERTLNAWLVKFDSNKEAAMRACAATYGAEQALKWYVNWRLFFMACAELFGYSNGEEWAVSHYLFEKKAE